MLLRPMRIAMLSGSLIFAAGCMQRSGNYEQGDQMAPGSQGDYEGYQDKNNSYDGSNRNQSSDKADVPIKFDKASMQKAAAELDLTKDINFKLEYVDYNETQAASITDGKVSITFKELPTGKTGDLTLSILDTDGTVVFKGINKATTLNPGSNKVDLVLRKVDPGTGTPDDTRLTITAILDDDATDDTDTDDTDTDDTDTDDTDTDDTYTDDSANPPDGDTDTASGDTNDDVDAAIAAWDGLSFLGNDSWNIAAIQ
jgi:hypothetical protein